MDAGRRVRSDLRMKSVVVRQGYHDRPPIALGPYSIIWSVSGVHSMHVRLIAILALMIAVMAILSL